MPVAPRMRRPTIWTPLRAWMDKHPVTNYRMAKAAGLSIGTISFIARGRTLPSLVAALKIEVATGGDVTPKDWLKTKIAKARWNWTVHESAKPSEASGPALQSEG